MEDVVGQRFSRLTVIEGIKHRGRSMWLCQCDCGNRVKTRLFKLLHGHTKSCGCLRAEKASARMLKHGHDKSSSLRTPTYNSWCDMRKRCMNPKSKDYANYGGRGITICERWNSYANFLADMGEKPKHTTLDRIDVNGGYGPSNCRWATNAEQACNRRASLRVTVQGKTMSTLEWAALTGLNAKLIRGRINSGWSHVDAVTTPPLSSRWERQSIGSAIDTTSSCG